MATLDLGKVRFSFKGDWSASTAYEYYDMVHYNHNSYVCNTLAGVAAGGKDPVADAGTNWLAMAEGVQGPKGDTGATGATGPQGPQGTTDPATTSSAGLVKPDGSTIIAAPDGTISALTMSAASASTAGKAGLVPAPAAGAQEKLLTGGGTFVNQYTDVQAAHASLPSDSVVALSLPASGGTVTSPGDGYVYFMATAGAAGQGIILICNGISASCFSHAYGDSLRVCLPVKQGKVITVMYTTTGGSSAFSFKRCEGAV